MIVRPPARPLPARSSWSVKAAEGSVANFEGSSRIPGSSCKRPCHRRSCASDGPWLGLLGPHVPASGHRPLRRPLQHRRDDAPCVDTVRQRRGSEGVVCPHGGAAHVPTQGRDETPPARQRSQCQACQTTFDDLTGPLLAGHHPPWRVWMLCLSCRALHRSNAPSAQALEVPPTAVQIRASPRREGLVPHPPDVTLTGEVAGDDVAVGAGPTGPPAAVTNTVGPPAAAGGRGSGGEGRGRRSRRRSGAGANARARSSSGGGRRSRRRPARRGGAARSPQGREGTPLRMLSTPGCPRGVTPRRPSVTPRASWPATTMARGAVRGLSTRWQAAGPCAGLGAVLTVASPKSKGRSTWAASRACTTSDDEARRDWGR
jgi:transposase-like protein